jgi:hypothetical protein
VSKQRGGSLDKSSSQVGLGWEALCLVGGGLTRISHESARDTYQPDLILKQKPSLLVPLVG